MRQGPASCALRFIIKDQCPALFLFHSIIKDQCPVPFLTARDYCQALWSATSQCLALQLNWYRHPVTQSCYLLLCQYTSWTYYNAVTLAALIKYTQLWLRFIKCRYLGIVICIPQGIAFQLILPHPVGSQFSIIVRLIPKDVNPHQFDSSHRMLIVISFNLCA
jgi:hypothetical protein